MNIELSNHQPWFWQWDTEQKVRLKESCSFSEVHFKWDDELAVPVKVTADNEWVKVPDELLQTGDDVTLYVYDTNHTLYVLSVRVRMRPKPVDYIYTKTEVFTWESLDARIKALEKKQVVSSVNGQTGAVTITAEGLGALTEGNLQDATNTALAQAKASGEFDGAPGAPGATPNVQIGNVTTLPAGSAATASITGTAANPLLNLGIPGADGSDDRFDGKFMHIAYSYVAGGGATNSREHYRHCAQNDYDAVKTDLRLTSDNQLVCCHDAGLTFNSDGYIVSYDSTNNTVIHDITKSQFLGYTFNTQYSGEHCHTCDLETYLNICKTYGKIAYINIRGEYIAETVSALIAALKNASFGMENVIINSFTKDALTAVRAAEPKLYLSLVIDPFTASERTTALNFARTTGACQICLYYSNGSHTLAEMVADSAISGWISDCIAAGIRLVGAQANDAGDADTLISIGAVGVQTRVSRLNDALALNIADLEVTATSGDSSTTLTLKDGKGNQKSAEIPKLTLSDSQVQAGVESWMDENAKPTTVWSKNVYNPEEAVAGYVASGGQVNTSDAYWTTGFIPVSPGDVLTFSKSGALLNAYYQAAYDSSKALVSRLTGNASSYTVPDGAAYARFTIKNSTATTDPVMICINNTDLTYEAYGSHVEAGLGVVTGVWTPTVDGAASYSVQIGRYAQMGDLAIVSFAVYGSFSGSTTARIKISGCPLTPADHQFSGGGHLSGYTAAANIVFTGWKAHINGGIYAVGQDAAATGANKWESEAIYQKASGDFSCGGTVAFRVAD